VCISNALLFQTLCTPADETPETSSPTGNKKDKKKDEKKDAAKVRFSFVETAERYLCTQRAKHSTLKKEHHILDDIVELRSLHDGIKGR
jgi:hypothetical protein